MIEGTEFFVILLVALVVLGPQRLPEMARKLGAWTAEMRRAAADLRQGLESEIGDVREIARDIREPLREVQDTMKDTKRTIDEDLAPKAWVGPKPVSGPTPEDAMADLERINAGETVDEDRTPGTWVGPKPVSEAVPETLPSDATDEEQAAVDSDDEEEATDSIDSGSTESASADPEDAAEADEGPGTRAEGGAA